MKKKKFFNTCDKFNIIPGNDYVVGRVDCIIV